MEAVDAVEAAAADEAVVENVRRNCRNNNTDDRVSADIFFESRSLSTSLPNRMVRVMNPAPTKTRLSCGTAVPPLLVWSGGSVCVCESEEVAGVHEIRKRMDWGLRMGGLEGLGIGSTLC